MMKKIILATAAVAAIATGTVASAPKAEAGYGFSVGYSHGHGHGYHGGYSEYFHNSYCTWESYPVTIKVWDHHTHSYYFKTIYKSRKVCY